MYLYILYSSKVDKYYIGVSENPNERLLKHNTKHRGFTSIANDWQIKYSEFFSTKTEALKREKEIKSWKSRKLLEAMINSAKRT
ncbi:MAG: hypothetical protein RL634_1100 [Bacteroidota bacterium]|jgi:putative endonuclease